MEFGYCSVRQIIKLCNGGSVNETSRMVSMVSAITNLPTPSKSGFDFAGCFTENNIQITENTVLPSEENITLIAK